MQVIVCPECDASMSADEEFCIVCGADIFAIVEKAEKGPTLAQRLLLLAREKTGVAIATPTGFVVFAVDLEKGQLTLGITEGPRDTAIFLTPERIEKVCETLQAYKEILLGEVEIPA